MKRLPNILSALRLLGAASLLLCDPTGAAFWVIYVLCGVSDMVDGYLARRLHAESKTGAVLDSVADICFVACCAIRLLPVLQIPTWLWIWAGLIVIIKMSNQISALVVHKHLCFPHTKANKLTGQQIDRPAALHSRSYDVPVHCPDRHRGRCRHLCGRSGRALHQDKDERVALLVYSI